MILAILQARTGSSRLPGKVLAPVLGEPMILRQLERVRRSMRIDRVVVATSTDPADDALAGLLDAKGIDVRRGDLADVLSRFAAVVDEFAPDTLVRLTADCPLADPAVIDRVVNEHLASGADYTSNAISRTFPRGLDVECLTAAAFVRVLESARTDEEHEHVTMAAYSRPGFELHSVTQRPDRSRLRWTVDRADDLEFVRAVYGALYEDNPAFDQDDIAALPFSHTED